MPCRICGTVLPFLTKTIEVVGWDQEGGHCTETGMLHIPIVFEESDTVLESVGDNDFLVERVPLDDYPELGERVYNMTAQRSIRQDLETAVLAASAALSAR